MTVVPYDRDHAALVTAEVQDSLEHARARLGFSHLAVVPHKGMLHVEACVPVVAGRGTADLVLAADLNAVLAIFFLDKELTLERLLSALYREARHHAEKAKEYAARRNGNMANYHQLRAAALAESAHLL